MTRREALGREVREEFFLTGGARWKDRSGARISLRKMKAMAAPRRSTRVNRLSSGNRKTHYCIEKFLASTTAVD